MSQNKANTRLISKSGILKTFEEIYDHNYKKMICIARKMVGDTDNASDIVQEVFIYLFNMLNKGNEIIHVDTWLYRATINKSIDHLKKQKRFEDLNTVKINVTEDDTIEKQERVAVVSAAISRLKDKEKIMIVLFSEGLSYKEIAEATGIKFSSIGKMLSRTIEKLEKELKKHHYEMY